MTANGNDLKRRLELIVEQLDQLPTLSSIALRLLDVTASDDSDAAEVINLVSADPSLSARLLQLCRRSHLGLSLENADVAQAVKLLGFNEVRAAAASVQVFELLDGIASRGGEVRENAAFDRVAFWQHSIAVAILSERIVKLSHLRRELAPSDAFLAGLMHDLGQLALHTILPRSFDRACEAADLHACSIDDACRRIIGLDSHTVGKHLAQHWQLPARLVETIWLNGAAPEATAAAADRTAVLVVSLADLVARRQLLTHPGHGPAQDQWDHLLRALSIEQSVVDRACADLHEHVAARASSLGMDQSTSKDVLRQSLARAAHLVDRLQRKQARQGAGTNSKWRTLQAVAAVLEHGAPGASLTSAVAAVAKSAVIAYPGAACTIIHLPSGGAPAELFFFDDKGAHRETRRARLADPGPPGAGCDASAVAPLTPASMWLEPAHHPSGPAAAQAMRLTCSADVSAFIIFGGRFDAAALEAASRDLLQRLWGGCISGAVLEGRAQDLSERLVATNRVLVEARESLARQKAAEAVAELACGAAHEMNNPLTVISGRAQSLARKVQDPGQRAAADEIVRQAHRLSDLITSLKLSTETPAPMPQVVSMIDLVNDAVRMLRERVDEGPPVRVTLEDSLPPARIDRPQMAHALRELLQNAQEANPRGEILVRIHTDPLEDRLMMSVIDTGPGLSQKALEHAFDPFFSEKPAGRQPGLGLSRAKRLVEANHGEIFLKNGADGGAVATIALRGWRAGTIRRSEAA